jgi:hypothetical protein
MMPRLTLLTAWFAAAMVVAGLAGCASVPAPVAPVTQAAAPDWEILNFPGKARTQFVQVRKDGRDAVLAVARASVSMKRLRLDIPPESLGAVRFSWMVPELIDKADMARRDLDDSPVRVVLVFDGDRSRFTPAEEMMSELARTLTGEEMPYATLMYVWCNRRAPGEVITNPRTSRIRKMVVESGAANLGRWLDYERDVRADYERAFGEPPGALRGVAFMTDSDNTRSVTRAWYGTVQLSAGGIRP